MLVPLLLAGVMALVGYKLSRGDIKPLRLKADGTEVGADPSGFVWNPTTQAWERPRAQPQYPQYPRGLGPAPTGIPGQYLQAMYQMMSMGQVPPPQVMQMAHREAQMLGDWQSVAQIEQMYLQMMPNQPMVAGEVQVVSGAEELSTNTDDDSMEGMEQVQATVSTQTVAPQEQKATSIPNPDGAPIDGVETADWLAFIAAVRTREPAFSDENYLGSFEHNRRRLRQLAIPESQLVNPNGQYKAFCDDIADYHQKHQKLIGDFAGDMVEINGIQHSVTMSGVLGLLKAAGPAGAKSWLTNEADRTAYPNTTQAFLRCNNCF